MAGMARISFTKVQAAGNDFLVVVDADDALALSSESIAELCDRRLGVGADGLIRIVRSERLAEGRGVLLEAPEAEWFMDYATRTGATEAFSANGLRAMARVLIDAGLAELPAGETLSIATRVGVKDVQPNSTGGFQTDLGRWRLAGGEPLVHAKGLAVARPGLGVEVGVPYVVVALSSEEELEALDLGVAPRIEPAHPSGLSTAFVVPQEPLVKNGVGRLRYRVHRRDLGETRSSGTAAAAAALAVRHWAGSGAPHHWSVAAEGGVLQVRMFPTEEGEHLGQAGPVRTVFAAEIDLARAEPER